MSYLYIAPLKDRTAFKIGQSNHPMKRLTTLAQFYPLDTRYITIVNCSTTSNSFQLETTLHTILKDKQIIFDNDGGTEFFDFAYYGEIVVVCDSISKINGYSRCPFVIDPTVKPPTPIQLLIQPIINRVKSKRLELNLTQSMIAKLAGISKRTVERFENNGYATFPNVLKILTVLGLDKEFLKITVNTPIRKRARTKIVFVGDNDHEPEKSGTQEVPV